MNTTEPIRQKRAKRRAVLNLAGVTYTIDATPTRQHLRRLLNQGAGWNELRAVTGCSHATIWTLLNDQQTTVTRETAKKILTVRLADVLTPSRRVPALGSIRRVRALYAAGHASVAITAATPDVCRSLVCQLASGRMDILTARVADGITNAYLQLHAEKGTCARNAIRARREGWLGPEDWHIDDLDEPDPSPATPNDSIDPIAVDRVLNGHRVPLTKAEQLHVTRILTERGETERSIAAIIGRSDRTIGRWRRANGWKAAAA